MRIIGGTRKRKTLKSVPGDLTRPTSDRLRESLFNILGSKVHGARVLDLYAGTGALGLEALSRGASFCVFVDHGKEALSVIRKNTEACGFQEASDIINWDIRRNLNCLNNSEKPFDLVFLDPPYARDLISPTLSALVRARCLAPFAILVCEHGKTDAFSLPPPFSERDRRIYGNTGVTFLDFDEK